MEASRKIVRDGFAEIYNRELGLSQPRNFSRRFSASEVKILNFFISIDDQDLFISIDDQNLT